MQRYDIILIQQTKLHELFLFRKIVFYLLDFSLSKPGKLAKRIPKRMINIEPICAAVITSPKRQPIKTETMGIKYVTLLANNADDKRIVALKRIVAIAVPNKARTIMAHSPSEARSFSNITVGVSINKTIKKAGIQIKDKEMLVTCMEL